MTRKYDIKWFQSLESTNNEASDNLDTYDNLSVIAAMEQTKGKGQRGNTWISDSGSNLTFSIIYKFTDYPASGQFAISQAITNGLTDYLMSYGIASSIKWPNDIYCGDLKICGILIENRVRNGALAASIAGIGFNINQETWPENIPNPTSLKNMTGISGLIPEEELHKILEYIKHNMDILYSHDGRSKTDSIYHSRMYRKDEWHDYVRKSDGTVFRGMITGVSEIGTLLVKDGKGSINEFGFKEIGYIL